MQALTGRLKRLQQCYNETSPEQVEKLLIFYTCYNIHRFIICLLIGRFGRVLSCLVMFGGRVRVNVGLSQPTEVALWGPQLSLRRTV